MNEHAHASLRSRCIERAQVRIDRCDMPGMARITFLFREVQP